MIFKIPGQFLHLLLFRRHRSTVKIKIIIKYLCPGVWLFHTSFVLYEVKQEVVISYEAIHALILKPVQQV